MIYRNRKKVKWRREEVRNEGREESHMRWGSDEDLDAR